MTIICHRGIWNTHREQNTLQSFKNAFDKGYGVELDVRDYNSNIVISHDPPAGNDHIYLNQVLGLFSDCCFNDQLIAINIKSDGILKSIQELLATFNITQYFTFDMSIPETIQYKKQGIKYFTRYSEYEKEPILIEQAVGIWYDCFYDNNISYDKLNQFIDMKKNICIVSAELHNRDNKEQWKKIHEYSRFKELMICTDLPQEAKEYFI